MSTGSGRFAKHLGSVDIVFASFRDIERIVEHQPQDRSDGKI